VVKKERSRFLFKTVSQKMLPSFYQNHLQNYFNKSEFLTLQILVWLLQFHKQVRIERLAATLPIPILFESRRRLIQRFLIVKKFSIPLLWFPLIESIITNQIKADSRLIIAIDRTQWKTNNILMVSVIWNKRAMPIYWQLLSKQGSSNLAEQIAVLRPVIKLFKKYELIVIGDREFRSVELADWLKHKKVYFVFRQKQQTYIKQGKTIKKQAMQKYISRLKDSKRIERRHSSFWVGLYGYSWCAAIEECQIWVAELMQINSNKLPFFARGLRAMTLIQSAL